MSRPASASEEKRRVARERAREWRIANPERKREANSKWREANQERKRAYDRQYQRPTLTTKYPEKRAYILNAKDCPCVDCGEQLEPRQMHFDHVRGEKLFEVGGNAVRRSLAAIKAEIAKCEVRCVHCHGRRHRLEQEAAAG